MKVDLKVLNGKNIKQTGRPPNEHIAAMPAVARRKGSEKINLSAPQQRQEAGTAVICQHVGSNAATAQVIKRNDSKKNNNSVKKIIQAILILTLFSSCAKTLYFPTYNEERVKYYTDSLGFKMAGMGSIYPNDSLSQFVNNWYSKHLRSLGEPVIYNITNQTKNIIRFTLLGTWSNPISYRLEQKDEKVSITYNRTNGQGGYGAGIRVENKTKTIDSEKWNMVISKMDSIDFWNIGTHDENMILDGEEWIFEALINGRYHFITRNSPDVYDGKDYAELCKCILKIYSE